MGLGDPLLPHSLDRAYTQYKSSVRNLQAELAVTHMNGPFPALNQASIYYMMADMHFASICLQSLRTNIPQSEMTTPLTVDPPAMSELSPAVHSSHSLHMLKCRSLFPTIRDDLHHHVRHLTVSDIREQVAHLLHQSTIEVCMALGAALQVMYEFPLTPEANTIAVFARENLTTHGQSPSNLHLAACGFLLLAYPIQLDFAYALHHVESYYATSRTDPATAPFCDMA